VCPEPMSLAESRSTAPVRCRTSPPCAFVGVPLRRTREPPGKISLDPRGRREKVSRTSARPLLLPVVMRLDTAVVMARRAIDALLVSPGRSSWPEIPLAAPSASKRSRDRTTPACRLAAASRPEQGRPARASATRVETASTLTCSAVERRLATAVDEKEPACPRASSPQGGCAVGWTSGVRAVCVGPKTLNERRRYASTTPIVLRLATDRPAESDRAGQEATPHV
jgi:hypothetical protein